MRYKVIACRVFSREISLLASRSSVVLDITWIRQGLHNYPSLLRETIQREIDRTEATDQGPTAITGPPEDHAAIILGFGLCGGATAGLTTRRLPLFIPRSHDCIALLLGSRARYERELAREPATYWFSPGWIEEATFPSGAQYELIRGRYAELYGDDNAHYLVNLERSSLSAYHRGVLLQWPELARPEYAARVAEIAQDLGWRVETADGEQSWLARVLSGAASAEDAVATEPGEATRHSHDDGVFGVTRGGGGA
jgi:hypothetical protein